MIYNIQDTHTHGLMEDQETITSNVDWIDSWEIFNTLTIGQALK